MENFNGSPRKMSPFVRLPKSPQMEAFVRNMEFRSPKNDLKELEYSEIPSSVSLVESSQYKDEFEKIKEMRRLENLERKQESLRKENEARKEKALKGMKYLLGLSLKYSEFFKVKVDSQVNKTDKNVLKERNRLQPTIFDLKESHLQLEDLPENQGSTRDDSTTGLDYIGKHLKYLEGGSLYSYQLEGVRWMTVLFENGLNGILADEMGLGKTIQVIALICHLLERRVPGPYLIVVPLSTLPNWTSEFKRFAPKVPVVVFHGSKDQRHALKKDIFLKYNLDSRKVAPVVLTSFQMPLMEELVFRKCSWQYIIIDEGHRIKNHESQLSKKLRLLQSPNRLLLTGTPLQNNITELWALLNFLLPHLFNNVDTFASLFLIEDIQDNDKIIEQEEKTNFVSTVHKVLAPFMLRRLKADVLLEMVPKKEVQVYCPISDLQRELYTCVLERNIARLKGESSDVEEDLYILDGPRKKRRCTEKVKNYLYFQNVYEQDEDPPSSEDEGEEDEEEMPITTGLSGFKEKAFIARLTMQNSAMMYRKIVSHPYLVHFPLDLKKKEKCLLIDENLVKTSGKLMVLDAMLKYLKRDNHKVLIFSTMVMLLELIEDYLIMRGYNFRTFDGRLSLDERSVIIDEFNKDENVFIFLISTRAGGLGLNLTAADTVIFFDRDWNPQVDIQAQDRCHRIGQTKPVVIYTLVSKNTIDEKILNAGLVKRRLEKIVIKDGQFKTIDPGTKLTEETLLELQQLIQSEDTSNGLVFTDRELQTILDRSDLYEQMKEKSGRTKEKK